MPTERDVLEQQLLLLLRHKFGSNVELVECTIRNQHHDYVVVSLELRHPALDVIVKLAGPEAPIACPFDRTAMLHRLVSDHTDIPMPQVLAVDVSYRTFPWRYFVKAFIPGYEWGEVRARMTGEELADAYCQVGHAVAQLHSIRFPDFGELELDGSVQNGASIVHALQARARHFIKNERLCGLFHQVLDSRSDLFRGVRDACLCHEDLHKHNILFQHSEGHWRLATILDFDKAWAGHAESDLARLDLWKGMASPDLWRGYEATGYVDPHYCERRPVYQFLWCLEYARETPAHLADTQRICAELGLAPIEHF